MVIKRKVSKIASFGAFIELEDGVDGLVHISQIAEGFAGNVKDVLQVGQEVEARVIKVDCAAFRIALSMRAVSMSDDEFKALVDELNSAENVKPAYTHALLAKEVSRHETVANLQGKTFEARKATLIEESAKYTLDDIATPESREKTMKRLQGMVFSAKCTNGRGTCGFLRHPDFEGELYIDEPVTNHVQIHTGQTWEFEIGKHKMGPQGPWVYRARKAILVKGVEPAPVAGLPSSP